ncbi:MAG: dicarboxylate/amino acid:cation symporter [Sphingomonadales bacterium]
MNTSENSMLDGLKHDKLWLKVIYGLILGVIVGFLLGPEMNLINREVAENIGEWMALPGNLFLTMIRFVVIPLVFSSIALGICNSGDAETVKKLGLRIVIYFMMTTAAAVIIAVVATKLINPGSYMDPQLVQEKIGTAEMNVSNLGVGGTSLPKTIVNLFPTNPIKAMADGALLKIVIAAGVIGIALIAIPKNQAKPMVEMLDSIQITCMAIVGWLMKFVPIAVFGLLAYVMILIGFDAIKGVIVYVGTLILVLLALLAMYMSILYFITGRSPKDFISKIREPMIIAFSTSSSSATMPVTLRAIENNIGVHPNISRMVIPVGATINMDGTAAYQAVVVVFLAQVFGITLEISDLFILLAITIGASVGTPGIPGGSLALLITMLIMVGIPVEGMALVLSVDRILDMMRTSVNVTGDMVAATVMDKWITPPDLEEKK